MRQRGGVGIRFRTRRVRLVRGGEGAHRDGHVSAERHLEPLKAHGGGAGEVLAGAVGAVGAVAAREQRRRAVAQDLQRGAARARTGGVGHGDSLDLLGSEGVSVQ